MHGRTLKRGRRRARFFDSDVTDLVTPHADGTVIGIEVKAAETVCGEGFRSLPHFANRLGDRYFSWMTRVCLDY